jgi:hypothetical protein
MKLIDILAEAPLPDDWEKDIYNERIPFAKRVRYAQERAKKLGSGSARVAFEIPYEGRQTVLKVAKNPKGAAQNDAEAQLLADWHIKQYNILIPLIDFDEENSYPTWIHMEKAEKAKASDFKRIAGAPLDDLIYAARFNSGKLRDKLYDQKYESKLNPEENETLEGLIQLLGNYGLPYGDFSKTNSWGIYKGKLVLVDIGLTNEIFRTHYSR